MLCGTWVCKEWTVVFVWREVGERHGLPYTYLHLDLNILTHVYHSIAVLMASLCFTEECLAVESNGLLKALRNSVLPWQLEVLQ